MFGIGKKIKSRIGIGSNKKIQSDHSINQLINRIEKLQASASFYLGDFQALTKLYEGTNIFVDTRDVSVTPHLLLNGEWEMDITFHWNRIIDEIKPKCVFDVGANTGYFGLLAAGIQRNAHIHFFEANPRLASLISKSAVLNGYANRMSVINKGVSDRTGDELKLTIPSEYFGSASFHHDLVSNFGQIEFLEKDGIKTVTVETITLDDYANEKKLVPDLVKIDVEGFEEHLMIGAKSLFSNDAPQVVFLEYTPGAYSSDFTPFLTSLFKRIYRIEGSEARELQKFNEVEKSNDWSMLILRK